MTFDQALAWAGGTQVALAAKLGVYQSAVSRWKRTIPPHYQFQIQVLSGGALTVDPELIPEGLRPVKHPQQIETQS